VNLEQVKIKSKNLSKEKETMAILGIDISKKTFDATLINQQGQKHHRPFDNNEKGFKKMQRWLKKHKVIELHACMEATNIYWEELAQFLYDQGYQVSVVNPARIKGFAQSQLRRNKTDKVDSDVVADFCAAIEPKLWRPPSPEHRKLRALVRYQEALQKTLTQQHNRLATCKDPDVLSSLHMLIDTLQTELERLEQQIQSFIDHHPDLKKQQKLLVSIKGIGAKTAIKLIAEMYDLAEYENAQAAAADAGLTPSHHHSGTSVRRKPRLSKVGKASVRGALYWPAITALQHNPIIRALKERLEAKGKCDMVIIGAAMRKLLHIAYGVLKNQTPFDPNYAN
jgi:transposase